MRTSQIRSSQRGMLKTAIVALLLTLGLTTTAEAQTVAPYMRLQFFANDGNPCSGCTLTTYAAGTTTPLATYSNQGLSVANDNPIVMNSAGRPASSKGTGAEVNVYLSAANYKFVLATSGGTTLWTSDNVYAPAAALLPSTFAVGDLIYADTTSTLARLADVSAGSYLRAGGVNTAPLWSTLKLPNTATSTRIPYASATDTWSDSAGLTFDGTNFATTGDVSFGGGDLIATADAVIRRNTSDGSDSGSITVTAGGAGPNAERGSYQTMYGNEGSTPGGILFGIGNVANSLFRVSTAAGATALEITGSTGRAAFTSSNQNGSFAFTGTVTTDSTSTQVMIVTTGATSTTTNARFFEFIASAGSTSVGTIQLNNNAVAYNTTSDERLKTFSGARSYGLSTIRRIHVGDFTWNNDPDRRPQFGVSAQALARVYPLAVSQGDDEVPWSVDYGKLTPPIIAAIQEIDADTTTRLDKHLDLIAGIEARLRALEAENAELRARLGLTANPVARRDRP